jgi:LytS/YehU family sensor histidine kinase
MAPPSEPPAEPPPEDTPDAAAELRALREQISPHFVYNALNTVASLVRTDPARARELLGEFADFTRYAFRTADGLTTLGEELDAVARYLAVERARFGARLRTQLRVPDDVRAVAVPFLAVQSLVVDAVRNGIEPSPSGGTLRIGAEITGGECVLTVDDDGVARPERPVHGSPSVCARRSPARRGWIGEPVTRAAPSRCGWPHPPEPTTSCGAPVGR